MKLRIYKVFLFIALMVFIQSYNLSAQSGWINSMSLYPSQPTTSDQIYLIVNASYTSGSCEQLALSIAIVGNSIKIQADHNLGPLTYICTSIDTIAISQLAAGIYSISYNLSVNGQTANDSLTFKVINPTGMIELNDQTITIYPNPARDFVKIIFDQRKLPDNIILMDLNGRHISTNILKLGNADSKEVFLSIKHNQTGIYYLQLHTDIDITVKKLIIQQ